MMVKTAAVTAVRVVAVAPMQLSSWMMMETGALAT